MTNGRKEIFERLKPIWEAVGELGELVENDPELNLDACLDEMWDEKGETHAPLSGTGKSPARRDEKVAKDPEAQFKMLAVAYATGDMDEVDRVIDYLAFVRRMKKQGVYELGHSREEDLDGQ